MAIVQTTYSKTDLVSLWLAPNTCPKRGSRFVLQTRCCTLSNQSKPTPRKQVSPKCVRGFSMGAESKAYVSSNYGEGPLSWWCPFGVPLNPGLLRVPGRNAPNRSHAASIGWLREVPSSSAALVVLKPQKAPNEGSSKTVIHGGTMGWNTTKQI